MRSDFGAHSPRRVVAAIESGHIRWVCLATHPRRTYEPEVRALEIEQAVRQDLVLVAELQMCDLYRAPTDGTETSLSGRCELASEAVR